MNNGNKWKSIPDKVLIWLPEIILFTLIIVGGIFPDELPKYEIPGLLILCPLMTWAIIKYDR
jgi:hypothetical protein